MTAFAHIREFKAAPGAGFGDTEAQRFGEFLETKVGLGTGPVEAEEIVAAARPKRSPIHNVIFDKDEKAAAHEYYLGQARHLVRHLVVATEVDGELLQTRAFHHVDVSTEDHEARGYVAQRIVWSTPGMAEQVVAKAHRELRAWTERYAQYDQLAPIVTQVEAVLAA